MSKNSNVGVVGDARGHEWMIEPGDRRGWWMEVEWLERGCSVNALYWSIK